MKATGTVSFDYKNLRFGGSAVFQQPQQNSGQSLLSKYNFGCLFTHEDLSIVTNVEDSLDKVKVSVNHNLNSRLTAGIEFTHNSKEQKNRIGTAFRYDTQNDSFFKGKIFSHSKDFSLSYGTRIAPNLSGILTMDSELSKLEVKGIKLALEYNNE